MRLRSEFFHSNFGKKNKNVLDLTVCTVSCWNMFEPLGASKVKQQHYCTQRHSIQSYCVLLTSNEPHECDGQVSIYFYLYSVCAMLGVDKSPLPVKKLVVPRDQSQQPACSHARFDSRSQNNQSTHP